MSVSMVRIPSATFERLLVQALSIRDLWMVLCMSVGVLLWLHPLVVKADEVAVRNVLRDAKKAERNGFVRDASDILWNAMSIDGLPGEASVAGQRWQHDFLWGGASMHFLIASVPRPELKYAERAVEAWIRYIDWFAELERQAKAQTPPAEVINKVHTASDYQFKSRRFLVSASPKTFDTHFHEFQSSVTPRYWNLAVVRGLITALTTCPAWNYPTQQPGTDLDCRCVNTAKALAVNIKAWLDAGEAVMGGDRQSGEQDLKALNGRIGRCER